MREIWPLRPAAYVPHLTHRADRAWPESNCYVDIWLELLHAAGCEPLAALPFVFTIDLEGDQWTFFKFPHGDLQTLYDVEVIELNVWRSLTTQIAEQIECGRPVLVEVDSFFLPDTAGTAYRTNHVKTSVAVQAIDVDARRLGYFHNAGYYELEAEDYAAIFSDNDFGSVPLPPYAEVARMEGRVVRAGAPLVERSLACLASHLARRPTRNPFRRYAERLAIDLEWLTGESLDTFHRYAFANVRQCGAAFELGGFYLRWLHGEGVTGFERAAAACNVIATSAKALQFQLARHVHTKRPIATQSILDAMAAAWDDVMGEMESAHRARPEVDVARHSDERDGHLVMPHGAQAVPVPQA